MILIEGKKLNDVLLGSSKEALPSLVQNSKEIFIEFDRSNNIMTISAKMVNDFFLNGHTINFNNLNIFLETENPLQDNDFFIFPKYSLSLYIDFKKKKFLEILLYADSLKQNYEKKSLKHYADAIKKNIVQADSSNLFVPYQSIWQYRFGDTENTFLNKQLINSSPTIGIGEKKIYHEDNRIFRFDGRLFTQLNLINPIEDIILNELNINSKKNISDVLLNENNVVQSRSHFIFPNLGFAIGKNLNDLEFFFFSETILKFWKNINRPITSW